MSARTHNHSLAAQTATALGFALVLWSGACLVSSPATSLHPSHHGTRLRFALKDDLCDIALPEIDGIASGDSSGPTLTESTPNGPIQADSVHLAGDSDEAPLVTQCSVLRAIPQDQTILAASPDHLIELPGTPPPALI